MKGIALLNILLLSVLFLSSVYGNIITDILNAFSVKTFQRNKLDPVLDQQTFDHLLMSAEGNFFL